MATTDPSSQLQQRDTVKRRICSVPGCCINKRLRPEVGFFQLPKNPEREKLWLKQICLEETDKPIVICEEHFEKEMVNKTNPAKRRLNVDAVPTLKLPNISKLPATSLLDQKELTKPSWVSTTTNMETMPLNNDTRDGFSKTLQSFKSKPNKMDQMPSKEKLKMIENRTPNRSLDGDAVISAINEINTNISKKESSKYHKHVLDDGNIVKHSVKNTEPQAQPQNKVIAVAKIDSALEGNGTIEEIINNTSSFTLQIHAIRMRAQEIKRVESIKAYIQLCLKLYLRFPKVYQNLQQILFLPPKSELKDVFTDTEITIDKKTLFQKFLSQKVTSFTVKQTECFVCIGETKIKPQIYYDIKKDIFLGIHDFDDVLKPEPAITAIVMIVHGIFEEWKQPVALGFLGQNTLSANVKLWVEKNIKSLCEIGFNVRAIVSHKDSNYFTRDTHYVRKKKIYCITDISSLFISFYYNFTKYDYSFNDRLAKSQHIVDYYKLDSQKRIPLTPELTDKHINPNNVQELNIKSVMEVFSPITAAAISTYIDFNVLDTSAGDTVELINKMNKLYEILNTGRLNDRSKSKKMFAGDESQIYFLTNMLELFDNLKLVNKTTESSLDESHNTLMEKFIISIKCILSLSQNFKSVNYEDFPVWRFNTDTTELFFNQVQNQSKSITKPTAKLFDFMFRQVAIIQLLKNPIKDFTPIEMQNVLSEFQIIINGFKLINDDTQSTPNATDFIISSSEYNTLEMEKRDGIILLAGFLLKKCTDTHKCEKLMIYNSRTTINVETLSMCESIMDDVQKNICVVPSAEFIEFVESMEIIFRTFINKEILCVVNRQILSGLLKFMESVDVPMPCQCFPVTYVKKLYARFRIYHMLKYNNELIRTKRNKRLVVNKL